jgi:DNA protecting protein DprA
MMRRRYQAILQLGGISGLAGHRLNTLFDRMQASGILLEDLPDRDPRTLGTTLGFVPRQIDEFDAARPRAMQIGEQSRLNGITIVVRTDLGWPAHLRRDDVRIATPWLFVLGDPSLLAQRLIGIGGSREATARSEKMTRNLVRRLVERDVVIVSGGARGIDAAAHSAAMASGGRTIVVLAQGIGTFHVPAQWREPIRQGRLAVVSEYLPPDDWKAFRAIQRNGTIVQMSDSFIVAQAGATGGTLSAGLAALRMRWPLHVVQQVGSGAESFRGNDLLIRQGGLPLSIPLHHAIGNDVIDAILAAQPPPFHAQIQLGLFQDATQA